MERKNTLRNLVLVATGVIALFMAFGGTGMIAPGFGVSKEVRDFAARQLVPMDGEQFRRVLATAQGRPTLMFVYASWCPWCKKQFPMLDALRMRFDDSKLQVAYVSIDDDAYALSRFLMEEFPEKPFTPYHAAPDMKGDFYGTLADKGFSHSGSVPYLVLLDRDGKPAGEFRGLTEIPVLLDAIRKVVP